MNSTPVNLQELKPEEFKSFLDSFDYVFSDCDGVIWAKTALPGVGKFFSLMKKHGKKIHFVSNNSLRSRENYERRFKDAEIENGCENLTVPAIAIAEYLKSVNFNKKVYSISCPETNNVLKSYGFEIKEGPDVGTDYYEDYVLYSNDDPEIATGAFTDLVAEETNRTPVTLGKPGKAFGEFAMKRAGVSDPSRVLFIGDMIEQDVGLGRATGFKTLLVLNNLTVDIMMDHKTIRPDFYAQSLGSLVPQLEQYFK
ncbi:hypothetical protein SFRURICE_001007 [Spodoptera frugiperda]|nr:hypothetical protein SFRURICE_001007 [Spodoptera frugiperda]